MTTPPTRRALGEIVNSGVKLEHRAPQKRKIAAGARRRLLPDVGGHAKGGGKRGESEGDKREEVDLIVDEALSRALNVVRAQQLDADGARKAMLRRPGAGASQFKSVTFAVDSTIVGIGSVLFVEGGLAFRGWWTEVWGGKAPARKTQSAFAVFPFHRLSQPRVDDAGHDDGIPAVHAMFHPSDDGDAVILSINFLELDTMGPAARHGFLGRGSGARSGPTLGRKQAAMRFSSTLSDLASSPNPTPPTLPSMSISASPKSPTMASPPLPPAPPAPPAPTPTSSRSTSRTPTPSPVHLKPRQPPTPSPTTVSPRSRSGAGRKFSPIHPEEDGEDEGEDEGEDVEGGRNLELEESRSDAVTSGDDVPVGSPLGVVRSRRKTARHVAGPIAHTPLKMELRTGVEGKEGEEGEHGEVAKEIAKEVVEDVVQETIDKVGTKVESEAGEEEEEEEEVVGGDKSEIVESEDDVGEESGEFYPPAKTPSPTNHHVIESPFSGPLPEVETMTVAQMVREIAAVSFARADPASSHAPRQPVGKYASPEPGKPVVGLGASRQPHRTCPHAGIDRQTSQRRLEDLTRELANRSSYPLQPPLEAAVVQAWPAGGPSRAASRETLRELQPGLRRMSVARKETDARMMEMTGLRPVRRGPGGTYQYIDAHHGAMVSPSKYEELYMFAVQHETRHFDVTRRAENAILALGKTLREQLEEEGDGKLAEQSVPSKISAMNLVCREALRRAGIALGMVEEESSAEFSTDPEGDKAGAWMFDSEIQDDLLEIAAGAAAAHRIYESMWGDGELVSAAESQLPETSSESTSTTTKPSIQKSSESWWGQELGFSDGVKPLMDAFREAALAPDEEASDDDDDDDDDVEEDAIEKLSPLPPLPPSPPQDDSSTDDHSSTESLPPVLMESTPVVSSEKDKEVEKEVEEEVETEVDEEEVKKVEDAIETAAAALLAFTDAVESPKEGDEGDEGEGKEGGDVTEQSSSTSTSSPQAPTSPAMMEGVLAEATPIPQQAPKATPASSGQVHVTPMASKSDGSPSSATKSVTPQMDREMHKLARSAVAAALGSFPAVYRTAAVATIEHSPALVVGVHEALALFAKDLLMRAVGTKSTDAVEGAEKTSTPPLPGFSPIANQTQSSTPQPTSLSLTSPQPALSSEEDGEEEGEGAKGEEVEEVEDEDVVDENSPAVGLFGVDEDDEIDVVQGEASVVASPLVRRKSDASTMSQGSTSSSGSRRSGRRWGDEAEKRRRRRRSSNSSGAESSSVARGGGVYSTRDLPSASTDSMAARSKRRVSWEPEGWMDLVDDGDVDDDENQAPKPPTTTTTTSQPTTTLRPPSRPAPRPPSVASTTTSATTTSSTSSTNSAPSRAALVPSPVENLDIPSSTVLPPPSGPPLVSSARSPSSTQPLVVPTTSTNTSQSTTTSTTVFASRMMRDRSSRRRAPPRVSLFVSRSSLSAKVKGKKDDSCAGEGEEVVEDGDGSETIAPPTKSSPPPQPEYPECPLCLCTTTPHTTLLPCEHALCTACFERIQTDARAEAQVPKCPFDRRVVLDQKPCDNHA